MNFCHVKPPSLCYFKGAQETNTVAFSGLSGKECGDGLMMSAWAREGEVQGAHAKYRRPCFRSVRASG